MVLKFSKTFHLQGSPPWIQKQYVPRKHWYITSLENVIFWNLVYYTREMVKIKLKQSRYRFPGSLISWQSAHEGGKVVSPTHRPPLPPSNYSWWSFLLQAESTPGPWCDRKDYINETFQWHHRATCHFPACSSVPQPTAPPRAPFCEKTQGKWNSRYGLLPLQNFFSSFFKSSTFLYLFTLLSLFHVAR